MGAWMPDEREIPFGCGSWRRPCRRFPERRDRVSAGRDRPVSPAPRRDRFDPAEIAAWLRNRSTRPSCGSFSLTTRRVAWALFAVFGNRAAGAPPGDIPYMSSARSGTQSRSRATPDAVVASRPSQRGLALERGRPRRRLSTILASGAGSDRRRKAASRWQDPRQRSVDRVTRMAYACRAGFGPGPRAMASRSCSSALGPIWLAGRRPLPAVRPPSCSVECAIFPPPGS